MDIRTERLRLAFERSGLNQTELCQKANITKGALSSYLSGRYFPKQKPLERLSLVLGVSINYLMGIDEPNEIQTIAAHHDNEYWTQEELDEIEQFKAYVRSKRNK